MGGSKPPEWGDEDILFAFCIVFLWYSVFLIDILEYILGFSKFKLDERIFTKKIIFIIGRTFICSLEFCNNHFNNKSTGDPDLSFYKEMILKSSWVMKYNF